MRRLRGLSHECYRLCRETIIQLVDPLTVAADLARRFAESAANYDKTGEFAAKNFSALFQAGLLGLVTSRKDGGLGAGLEITQAVIPTIASGDFSTALIFAIKRGR